MSNKQWSIREDFYSDEDRKFDEKLRKQKEKDRDEEWKNARDAYCCTKEE